MKDEEKSYGLYLKLIMTLDKKGKLVNFQYKEDRKEKNEVNKNEKTFKTLKYFINKEMFLVLTKDNKFIQVQNQSEVKTKKGEKLLFQIKKNGNSYILINPIPGQNSPSLSPNIHNFEVLDNQLWWYALNSDNEKILYRENDDYYLNENDIIKIGDIKYKVTKINIKSKNNENSNNTIHKNIIQEKNQKANDVFLPYLEITEYEKCKFYEGYKAKLCNCRNKLLEIECLKQKLSQQGNVRIGNNYTITTLGCNECQNFIPIKIKINKKIEELIEVKINEINEWENEDYIIIESFFRKLDGEFKKFIYCVNLKNNEIKIGRNDDRDIHEKENSISHNHSIIKNKNGKILIKNDEGKSGTLILIKDSIISITEKKIQFQIGNVFIEACLEKKENLNQENIFHIQNRE